ncbi:MAG TPA: EpsG family protein, partial [Methylophaga sp.]|nr:EpsG family protein [Methylophaga sp.]
SKDWVSYQWFFDEIYVKTSWIELLMNSTPFSEPLFFVTTKAALGFISLANFLLLVGIALFILKMHFLTKLIDDVFIVTFFYVCMYLFLFEGTALRIAYATSFIIPSMYYLQKKKLLTSILLFLIATQIQLTSVVFIIMYPLFIYRRLNFLVIALFVIAPLAILLNISAFNFVVDFTQLFSNKYLFYGQDDIVKNQNSTGLFYYFIGFFYMFVIAIGYYLKQQIMNEPFKRMIFSLAMIGCASMCLFYDHVVVGARVGEMLLISMVLLLTWLFQHFREKDLSLYNVVLILIFMGYALARFFYLYPTLALNAEAFI